MDEVGRGPLAGPVVAATCYFPDPKNKLINLNYFNDSKLLTTKKRIICYNHILELKKLSLVKFTIGEASVLEIDSINILQASLLAMKRAIIKANNKEATFFCLRKGVIKSVILKNLFFGIEFKISGLIV